MNVGWWTRPGTNVPADRCDCPWHREERRLDQIAKDELARRAASPSTAKESEKECGEYD